MRHVVKKGASEGVKSVGRWEWAVEEGVERNEETKLLVSLCF